jgi:hypothetical protein
MRGKGINYDTGFYPGGHISREHFDADVVRREMGVIARELRCTAVRISGGDPGGSAPPASSPRPRGWRCGSRRSRAS